MLGRDVAGYAQRYRAYFERYAPQAKEPKTMLDPAPRVVLDPAARLRRRRPHARKDAAIVEELYDHTIDVILRAEALGGWRALDQQHIFRHRVLGPRAGEAAQGGRAAGLRRRGGAGHRRRLGHRQGLRRSVPQARRRGGRRSTAIRRSRRMWQRPDFLGVTLRPDRSPRPIEQALDAGGAALRRRRHAGAERRHLPLVRSRSQDIAAGELASGR